MLKNAHWRFVKTQPPNEPNLPAYWFIFKENFLLIQPHAKGASIPLMPSINQLGVEIIRQLHVGIWKETPCYIAEVSPDAILPEDLKWIGLRQAYGLLPDEFFSLAGEAIQILDWDRTHQFCGRCGTATVSASHEYAKKCPACGLTAYPRISPAVIMLIERDGQILLSRSPHFPKGMYSIQAGFVEPGESLEQAVEREIMEEVGIQIITIIAGFNLFLGSSFVLI